MERNRDAQRRVNVGNSHAVFHWATYVLEEPIHDIKAAALAHRCNCFILFDLSYFYITCGTRNLVRFQQVPCYLN
jgi:hypothetical protein